MAIDTRNQKRISTAEALGKRASQALKELVDFSAMGSERTVWRQPYCRAVSDNRLIHSLRDALVAIELAVEQLETAESSLVEQLITTTPFICPAALDREIETFTYLASEARPGNGDRLLPKLKTVSIPDADRDRIRFVLKVLDIFERRGVDKSASDLATKLAYFGTPQWEKYRRAEIDKYNAAWATVVSKFEMLLKDRTTTKRRLQNNHGPSLIGALENPLPDETASVELNCERVSAVVADASSYISNETDVDFHLNNMYENLFSSPSSLSQVAYLPAATLNDQDVALAEQWASSAGGSEYWQSTMLSARRAERSLLRSYAILYGMATDISIEQLATDGDPRWKLADIESGGSLIDVKNARKSFSSPKTYSEHCIPRFKSERIVGDVIISGVLSSYVVNEQPDPKEENLLTWLGEVTQTTISVITKEFRSDHLDPQLRIDHRGSFVPPWLFEYPEQSYEKRTDALAELHKMSVQFPRRELPIAAGLLVDGVPAGGANAQATREARALQARLARIGVSRPVLFLHILDRFCVCHIEHSPFPAHALKTVLFPTDEETSPVATFDPLATVYSLLETLAKAEPALDGFQFTRFRFSAPGIFRGLREDGCWQTIIAYCGGWKSLKSNKSVRCGKNPIVLGEDEPCQYCSYLVCNSCGFCKQRCQGLTRQLDWNGDDSEPSSADRSNSPY